MSKKEERPTERLYTLEAFGKIFDVSRQTIRSRIQSGDIRESEIVRFGKTVRIKHAAYERLVNGQRKENFRQRSGTPETPTPEVTVERHGSTLSPDEMQRMEAIRNLRVKYGEGLIPLAEYAAIGCEREAAERVAPVFANSNETE